MALRDGEALLHENDHMLADDESDGVNDNGVHERSLVQNGHEKAPALLVPDEEAFVDEDHDSWLWAMGRWWRLHSPPSKEVCSNITVPGAKHNTRRRTEI